VIAAATSSVKEALHVLEEKSSVDIRTSNLLLICQLLYSTRTGNEKEVAGCIELGIDLNLTDKFNGF
jgi:hypothetical protein